ncbi:MAG: 4-(cytidine 5'-diphospho)-2-C-methyl-D-erythritol kinase [Chthoniobacterales bacterium]
MDSMQLFAPAKINLSLKVLGRREDGFHEIETLIAPISLGDRIVLERTDKQHMVEFSCDDASIPTGDDNLVVRAAGTFFAAAAPAGGARISLEKRIPHAAGLGGGSSDAATTLLGLDALFKTALGPEKLVGLAARLGSDVPFFILRSAAICRGQGETVVPLRSSKLPLLLVKPAFGVPTAWAYSHLQKSRELPEIDYTPQCVGQTELTNDLERPVFEKYVFLATLKTWLRAQPEVAAALLSGSGSTVFAILRSDAKADDLAQRVSRDVDPDLWTFACETLGNAIEDEKGLQSRI